MRRSFVLLALGLVATTTACGSTAQLAGGTAANQVSQNALPTGSAAAAAATGGVAGAVASGAGSPTGSSASGGPDVAPQVGGGGGGAGAGGPGYRPAPGALGRGVTRTTISLGVLVPTDSAAVASSFGITGGSTISVPAALAAEADDINAHGGILGRKLVLVEHDVNSEQLVANPDQVVQAACTDYAQDRPVFAILSPFTTASLVQCTAQMGSPLLDLDSTSPLLRSQYDADGGVYLYGPGTITADRMAALFIQSLVDRGFFQRWNIAAGGPGVDPVKLGLIYNDAQAGLYALETRDLASYGYHFSATFSYTDSAQAGIAATQSAVLRFESDGITQVFGASDFFLDDAQQQHYFPRYAYLPGLGALGVQNAPAQQLVGAMTVGWQPVIDVNAAQDPGDTPGGAHCRAVMAKAGVDISGQSNLAVAYAVCDGLTFPRDGLDAGGQPTVAAFARGVDSLGSGWPSALSFVTWLAPGHHASVDAVRDMAFETSCSCLVYTSTTNRS